SRFLCLLCAQLAEDRGHNADATPLYLSGLIGSLFKVRLTTHGYTLVAKGVETVDLGRLQHEERMYKQIHSVQGKHVPVCLGLVDLVLPYYYDGGEFRHFLLFSWAGRSMSSCTDEIDRKLAVKVVANAFAKLHYLRVLHGDAEPRNILYDTASRSFMVTDFERAEYRERQPLSPMTPNSCDRKRKREELKKQESDSFAKELRCVVASIARCLEQRAVRHCRQSDRGSAVGF
ncbi:hypothetical protein F5883DRAFT_436894, partial [Diaporthe sp. PMI_573]